MVPVPTIVAHQYDVNKVDVALARALETIAITMIQIGGSDNTYHQYLSRVANSYPEDLIFNRYAVLRIKTEAESVMTVLTDMNSHDPTCMMVTSTVGIALATTGIALQELERVGQ